MLMISNEIWMCDEFQLIDLPYGECGQVILHVFY